MPVLHKLVVFCFLVTAICGLEYESDDFYKSIEHLAPPKSVTDALRDFFPNPMKASFHNDILVNPCCPQHSSRFICDPLCVLEPAEVQLITEVSHEIITASGCSCKKVKHCTMQENGFRVFVVVVPTDFIRNISLFMGGSTSSPDFPDFSDDKNLSLFETIGKNAPSSHDMLMEWLAQTLRMFVWQSGRCDDDFILAVMHDHHNAAGTVYQDSGNDIMLTRIDRLSWSAGSSILNQSTISDHCLDEVFQPLRGYVHSMGRDHRRLSIRKNETSTTIKFAEAIERSLTRLFKALNRRDDIENPCYQHEGEEEDKSSSSQQLKLLIFAGITSILLPILGCLFVALSRFISRRYCTEDPSKDQEIALHQQNAKARREEEEVNSQSCSPILYLNRKEINPAMQTPQPVIGVKRLHLLSTPETFIVDDPLNEKIPTLNAGPESEPEEEPNCRPPRYYCGNHKHRLIYRYYNAPDNLFIAGTLSRK